jgi:cell division protein FtsA
VQKELKQIGKAGLLPAGAVLVGGGAKLTHAGELAKEILGLPIQIGFPLGFGGILDKVDDPSYATAAGLILWGLQHGSTQTSDNFMNTKAFEVFSRGGGETVEKMREWVKKFLP